MNGTLWRVAFLAGLAIPALGQTAPYVDASSGPVVLGYTNPKPKTVPKKKKPASAKKAVPAKPKKTAKPAARKIDPGACDGETKKYCAKEAELGRNELHDCLLAHVKSLSGKCRTFTTSSVDAACRTELGLLCGGMKAGSAEANACLRSHQDSVTTECGNALDDEDARKSR